jgi:hypothetical protein
MLFFSVFILHADAQKTYDYNLIQLLTQNKLDTNSTTAINPLNDSFYKQAISVKGIVCLNNVSFSK